MTWDAHCVFKLPLRGGVERPAVKDAVRGVVLSSADLPWMATCLYLSDQALSVRFGGKVSEDFGRRVLEPALRSLEPLAASPVAIAVFDRDSHEYRSPLAPAAPRLSKTLGASSVLPQLQPVHGLIDAALQAAAQLPDTSIRAHLLEAAASFTNLRTTQGWSVEDVMEQARTLQPALYVTSETARSLLFRMDELTETSDLESAVFNRCVLDGLIAEDPDMSDGDEWEQICEELGLDSSFVYSDDQVREHTRLYRAGPEAEPTRDGAPR